MLRYIVERTLEGSADDLKERTIGVDVFEREPDYDTASDHVVRSAMAEVRKRLAQYYQEDGGNADLRVEVQPGSYVPQFRVAVNRSKEGPAHTVSYSDRTSRRRWVAAASIACGVAVSIALVLTLRVFGLAQDPVDSFWRPVFASPKPILLCIGNLEGGHKSSPDDNRSIDGRPLTIRDFHRQASQTVHIADATTLARFAGLLEASKKAYRIATQSEADFVDLQNGPAILIGLLNNDWTERLVGKLRFTVERPGPGKVVIRDTKDPSRNDWSMDYLTPLLDITKDYALVLRVLDPKTDQMVVTAGGISVFGTLAAGEFLTSERELRGLEAVAPKGWERRNIEIVLSTDVIRGKSGRPRIVATHFW